MLKKQEKRHRRHKRIRTKLFGTAKKPRLTVFRSLKHVYVQLVDDEKGKTLLAVSDQELKKLKAPVQKSNLAGKKAVAFEVGKLIAKKALEKKIEKVVFDRGGYQFHGKIKAVAEGAKEGGLKF